MNVTRDIVKDLLALDLAGEASADTHALVEEWLRKDPELARQAKQAGTLDLPDVAPPPPAGEKRALDRTRRRLRLRSVVLGLAIYFATLPLTVTFNRSGFQGLLISDWWERIVLIGVAIGLWALYFVMSRRLRVSGL
jgi:hypothetical protein